MGRVITAAVAYFAIVFCVAFLLGTLRTLVVTPRLGEVAGVLIEAPILLWVSWVAAGDCINRFAVPTRTMQRLIMGLVAFALLMATEAGLGISVFARPLAQQLTAYTTPAGAIGLLAQIAFGLTPLIRSRRH